jgi:nucleolar complex protein 3
VIGIFRNDLTGVPSLEAVQLLNRMIKERHFNVHPDVLTCLLHLRLKSELGVRASDSRADKEDKTKTKGKMSNRRTKGKSTDQPYLSKNTKKALKEKKGIEREVREAEAEVDKEERARMVSDGRDVLL